MRVLSTVTATALVAAYATAEKVIPVFETMPTDFNADLAFNKTYESFLAEFDTNAHAELMKQINDGISSYMESEAFVGSAGSNCDNLGGAVALPGKVSAYPGGITKRLFGMDVSKLVDKLSSSASGAAGAQGAMPGMLAMQAIQAGAGLLKGGMHTLVQILPLAIPPNQPLQCLPMITGHNCFGAIQYRITAADFVIADTTDASLDGAIAGFPALYKQKVGTTSDTAYKTCFSAYMGMHCASIFPRCSVPQALQNPGPSGRLPMCFTHCLATLVACPGFWVEDIMNECQAVSVPPACSMSVFANFWLLPPQYTSYEDSLPTGLSCPSVPAGFKDLELAGGANIYDEGAIVASPYATTKLPGA